MHFVLMKNNKAALSNERVVQIDFIFQESFYYKKVFSSNPELIFFFNLVTELITEKVDNVKLQTRNCKLRFAVCRFQ